MALEVIFRGFNMSDTHPVWAHGYEQLVVKENHRVTFLDKLGYRNEVIMARFTSIILRFSLFIMLEVYKII